MLKTVGTNFNPVFDTLTVNGLITPNSVAGIKGTTTNDNAQAGSIGEYVSSYIGSLNQLASAVAENITSITLTAGDWDVEGTIGFIPAATTSITQLKGSNSLTSNTFIDNAQNSFWDHYSSVVPGGSTTFYKTTPTTRVSIASTTTIYLVAQAVFAISLLYAVGNIRARRVR